MHTAHGTTWRRHLSSLQGAGVPVHLHCLLVIKSMLSPCSGSHAGRDLCHFMVSSSSDVLVHTSGVQAGLGVPRDTAQSQPSAPNPPHHPPQEAVPPPPSSAHIAQQEVTFEARSHRPREVCGILAGHSKGNVLPSRKFHQEVQVYMIPIPLSPFCSTGVDLTPKRK